MDEEHLGQEFCEFCGQWVSLPTGMDHYDYVEFWAIHGRDNHQTKPELPKEAPEPLS